MKVNENVSIVIPCYNAEQWVSEAIESALAQTHPCEVIVIDDGSKDGSIDVLRRYGDRIRWETGPNRGGCEARNRGVELATGQWIQFLDADDILLPHCVSAKLAQSGDPMIVPCTHTSPMLGAANQRLPAHWLRTSYTLKEMLEDGTPPTQGPLHRRDNLRNVGGFKPGLRCAQEFELHLRLAIVLGLHFQAIGVEGSLTRPTPGSVSRSAGQRMIATIAEVLLDAHALLLKNDPAGPHYDDLIAQRVTRLARRLWHLGDSERALALVARARTLSDNWQCNVYQSRGAELLARVVGFKGFEYLRAPLSGLRGSRAVPSS